MFIPLAAAAAAAAAAAGDVFLTRREKNRAEVSTSGLT